MKASQLDKFNKLELKQVNLALGPSNWVTNISDIDIPKDIEILRSLGA